MEGFMGSAVYRPQRADLLAASRLHHLATITGRRVVAGTCAYAIAAGALGYVVSRPSEAAPLIGALLVPKARTLLS